MRRRTWLKTIGVAPIFGTAPLHAAPAIVPLPKLGTPIRLLDVPLINGGVFRATEAEGHVTLVYWWASWCPFYAIQNPYIQKLVGRAASAWHEDAGDLGRQEDRGPARLHGAEGV